MSVHKQLRSLKVTVVVLALISIIAVGMGPANANAQDAPGGNSLLVNITGDDVWAGNMAIGLATRAATEGTKTIIFLNVRGVYLADSRRLPETAGNSDTNIHEKLHAFTEAGGTIIVCPSCSAEAGISQDDYIDGANIGEPGGILPYLTDPSFNIISY